MAFNPVQKFDFDIEKVKKTVELTNAVLTILHGALSEVVKCEVSQQGAIDMKAIAEVALCEVQRIALGQVEVQNA